MSMSSRQVQVNRLQGRGHPALRRSCRTGVLKCKATSISASIYEVSSKESTVYDVVVVGAGISGLVTALALKTKHSDSVNSFLVTEARERVGGNITSCSNADYVWEEGPNSCQPSDSVLEAAVRLATS
jgi:protoporphyrinogen/coproporphyrinogen III oxidase